MKLKKIIFSGLAFLTLNSVNAQESVNASGGEATGAGGEVSYSVGQVFYTTDSGANGSVAKGVQQAFEISVVAGVDDVKGVTLQVSAYPNPVIDFLVLKIENNQKDTYSYQLYDIQGKLLDNQKIVNSETQIGMSAYLPATYFLKVIKLQDNKELIFKIVKQ